MNWETYKDLSVELREEYDWKFKDKGIFNAGSFLNNVIIFFAMIIIMLFMFQFLVTNPDMISYQDELIDLMKGIAGIVKISFIYIAVYIVFLLFKIIYFGISRQVWIRKNKIKNKGPWWKI